MQECVFETVWLYFVWIWYFEASVYVNAGVWKGGGAATRGSRAYGLWGWGRLIEKSGGFLQVICPLWDCRLTLPCCRLPHTTALSTAHTLSLSLLHHFFFTLTISFSISHNFTLNCIEGELIWKHCLHAKITNAQIIEDFTYSTSPFLLEGFLHGSYRRHMTVFCCRMWVLNPQVPCDFVHAPCKGMLIFK